MAKIKWKNKSETEREVKEQETLKKQKEKFKKKAFHTLPTAEKWELVEIVLRQLGLLEDDPQ